MEPVRKKEVLPEDTLRLWTRDLLLGLEHLHLSGVCHATSSRRMCCGTTPAARSSPTVSTIMRRKGSAATS